MPLSKDILGLALYTNEQQFNDKSPSELGDLETARIAFWKVQAETIINHLKSNGVISVNVTTTGTATNHAGTGTGTIS